MWSIACSHLLTNMHVCAIMNNERTYEHEQQANGARATNMPACIDQTSIFKASRNKQAEHHRQREYITAYHTNHHHTGQATTKTLCMDAYNEYPVTYYMIMQDRTWEYTKNTITLYHSFCKHCHRLHTFREHSDHLQCNSICLGSPCYSRVQLSDAKKDPRSLDL